MIHARIAPAALRTRAQIAACGLALCIAGVAGAAQQSPDPSPKPGAPAPADPKAKPKKESIPPASAKPSDAAKPAAPPKVDPKPGNAKPADPDKPDASKGDMLPDLDELLGISMGDRPTTRPEGDAGPLDPAAADPNKAELERALSAGESSEMFLQAVRQMADVADLLELAGDPGIRTQRIQEEIIKKLDVLIQQAEQQASQSQSSSSQDQESEQQKQQVGQQPQPGKQQEQNADQRTGDNHGERTPPALREGVLPDVLDSARAAWGALPPRVRDALNQGSNDKMSSIYKSLTEEYYKRLAEEAKKQ